MRKLTVNMFIIIAAAIVAAPSSTRAGLVAFYDFEDDAQDASTNANHATANGSGYSYVSDVAGAVSGRSNKSISLTGDSGHDYVSLPANFNGAAQTTGASVSLWVKTASGVDQDYVFSVSSSVNTTPLYGIQGDPDDNAKMRIFYRNDAGTSANASGTVTVFGNGWHHLVLTHDGTTVRAYVDGASTPDIALTLPGGALTVDNESLGVIDRPSPFGYLPGQIDEVAIYDHVLTTDEVRQLAAGRNPGNLSDQEPVDGPVAFYGFEGNSIDSTTNVYDGTVTGTATYSTDVATAISSRSTKAFSFNGSSYITLPHAGIYFADRAQATGASISMWVKGAAQDEKALFSEGWNVDLATDPIYNFQSGDAGSSQGDRARLAYRGDSGTIDLDNVSTASAFDSTWNHIVLTDDSGSVNMYINGAHDSTHTYAPDVGAPFAYSTLGALQFRGGAIFGEYTGLMDEVIIYDRVLTQAEVARLAAGEAPSLVSVKGTIIIIW